MIRSWYGWMLWLWLYPRMHRSTRTSTGVVVIRGNVVTRIQPWCRSRSNHTVGSTTTKCCGGSTIVSYNGGGCWNGSLIGGWNILLIIIILLIDGWGGYRRNGCDTGHDTTCLHRRCCRGIHISSGTSSSSRSTKSTTTGKSNINTRRRCSDVWSGGKHSRSFVRSVSRMMQRRRLVHFFVDTLSLPIVKPFSYFRI